MNKPEENINELRKTKVDIIEGKLRGNIRAKVQQPMYLIHHINSKSNVTTGPS